MKIQFENLKDEIEKGAYLSDSGKFYFELDGAYYQVDLDRAGSQRPSRKISAAAWSQSPEPECLR